MTIKNRVYNNTLYVLLSGELDEHTAKNTRITLDEIFSSNGFMQIIIDLSELAFMDSTGIGVLIGRYKKMKDKNIPIYICNPSMHAEKIFVMDKGEITAIGTHEELIKTSNIYREICISQLGKDSVGGAL